MEWSLPPHSSPSPDLTSTPNSTAMQPSSTTSSVIDSASITNNSASATSISTTPERTSIVTEGGTEEGKKQDGEFVEAKTEGVAEKEEGFETLEGREEIGKGEESDSLNEGKDEQDQTRNTRKSQDRAQLQQETPATPSTKKTVKEAKTVTRQLRSSAKHPSSAQGKKFADKTRRQSKRLSIIASSKLVETTTPSAPRGKRSHDVMAAGSKSANAKLQGNYRYSADGSILRASKRSRKTLSYNEDTDDESFTTYDTPEALSTESRPKQKKKKKIWLNQGLYLGQGQDLDVRKRPGGKAKKRGKSGVDRPPALPLPMFTGLVIMDTTRDFKLPFNVFAPSPWRCGPIQNWKKLNHNVLIGDASQVWKREKASMAKCVCTEKKGCDEDCLNRCTWMECDEGNCNVEPENCSNRAFADLKERVKTGTKFAEGVEVIMTQNCGHGLRATRGFAPRQIVVEYTGEIITQEESERRMIEDYKDNNNYYLMLFHQNMILDATRGSVARFVNHSCNPNCRMEKWLVDGKPRMALFAGDDGIEAGDELTYDYNFNWFTGVSQQACHCGSENCRGALGKRADGLQKKPEPPPAKGKKGKGKKKGVNGKGGTISGIKKPTRGRPKKLVARVQKSVIITPKRKYTKRKVMPTPVISPSPAPEDSPEPSSPSSGTPDHLMEASSSTLKSSASLSEAARRRRTHDKTGRPRVTKTYKVNKTIRGGKGKIIPKSVTSKKAVSALKMKTYENVLAAATTTTTVKAKASSLSSSSSISSVSSGSTNTAMGRVTRRSLGATTTVDDQAKNNLLEKAITTVLATVGVEDITDGVIGATPALSAVQVAG